MGLQYQSSQGAYLRIPHNFSSMFGQPIRSAYYLYATSERVHNLVVIYRRVSICPNYISTIFGTPHPYFALVQKSLGRVTRKNFHSSGLSTRRGVLSGTFPPPLKKASADPPIFVAEKTASGHGFLALIYLYAKKSERFLPSEARPRRGRASVPARHDPESD